MCGNYQKGKKTNVRMGRRTGVCFSFTFIQVWNKEKINSLFIECIHSLFICKYYEKEYAYVTLWFLISGNSALSLIWM